MSESTINIIYCDSRSGSHTKLSLRRQEDESRPDVECIGRQTRIPKRRTSIRIASHSWGRSVLPPPPPVRQTCLRIGSDNFWTIKTTATTSRYDFVCLTRSEGPPGSYSPDVTRRKIATYTSYVWKIKRFPMSIWTRCDQLACPRNWSLINYSSINETAFHNFLTIF